MPSRNGWMCTSWNWAVATHQHGMNILLAVEPLDQLRHHDRDFVRRGRRVDRLAGQGVDHEVLNPPVLARRRSPTPHTLDKPLVNFPYQPLGDRPPISPGIRRRSRRPSCSSAAPAHRRGRPRERSHPPIVAQPAARVRRVPSMCVVWCASRIKARRPISRTHVSDKVAASRNPRARSMRVSPSSDLVCDRESGSQVLVISPFRL